MRVKVPGTGTSYDSAEEAFTAAAELEELRQVEVGELREAGREREADLADDRYQRIIEKTRTAARAAMAKEAGRTEQPKGRPKRSRRAAARTALRSRRGGGRRQSSALLGGFRRGASGRVLRETGIQRTTTSVTRVTLEAFGLILGIAFLIVVLERPDVLVSQQERSGRYGGLVGGVIDFLGKFLGPVDPLSGVDVATGQPYDPASFTAGSAAAAAAPSTHPAPRLPARSSTNRVVPI